MPGCLIQTPTANRLDRRSSGPLTNFFVCVRLAFLVNGVKRSNRNNNGASLTGLGAMRLRGCTSTSPD